MQRSLSPKTDLEPSFEFVDHCTLYIVMGNWAYLLEYTQEKCLFDCVDIFVVSATRGLFRDYHHQISHGRPPFPWADIVWHIHICHYWIDLTHDKIVRHYERPIQVIDRIKVNRGMKLQYILVMNEFWKLIKKWSKSHWAETGKWANGHFRSINFSY